MICIWNPIRYDVMFQALAYPGVLRRTAAHVELRRQPEEGDLSTYLSRYLSFVLSFYLAIFISVCLSISLFPFILSPSLSLSGDLVGVPLAQRLPLHGA